MEFGIKKVIGSEQLFTSSASIWTCRVYKVIFISDMGCRLILQGKELEFEANSLLYIPKEIQVRSVDEEDRLFTLIYFSEEFFGRSPLDLAILQDSQLFQGEELLYHKILLPAQYQTVRIIMENYLERSKMNYGHRLFREIAFTLVKQIVLLGWVYISELPVSVAFVKIQDIDYARRFQQLVEQYVQTEKKVPFYAEQLQLSPRKLTQISKKVLGRTPKELINDGLIRLSKRMLRKTKKSIKQIAWEMQYMDENNFSTAFSRHCGMTPSEYRKRWSE